MRSIYGRLHRRFGRRLTGVERKRRTEAHYERLRRALPIDFFTQSRRASGASKGSVLILGGGFAGLSAGSALANTGFDVTVVEAVSAVGGRVSSPNGGVVPGRIIERGGELIGLNHPLWLLYANLLGLGLSVLTTDDIFEGEGFSSPVSLGGQSYTSAQALALYEAMSGVFAGWCSTALTTLPRSAPWHPWTISNASTLDGQSLASNIPSTGSVGAGLTWQDVINAITLTFYLNNTVDPSQQSWLANLAQFSAGSWDAPSHDPTGFFDDTEVLRCESGNQQLAITLAEIITNQGGSILYGTTVSSLTTSSSGVTATIGSDSQTFDYAIIAVPVSKLPGITINGQSVSATSHNSAVKYLAATDSRFWIPQLIAPTALSDQIGMTWEGTDNQMNTTADAIELSVFAGGAIADNAINAPDPATFFQDALNGLYGQQSYLENSQFVNWPSAQNIGTGYSCPSINQVVNLQQTYAGAIQGIVFIAGEHASPAWFGFMEGALESGIAAAMNVVQAVGIDVPMPR